MPQTYTTLPALFTAIANAIRAKTGGTAEIVADDFPTAIANIPSGGGSIIPSDLPSDGKTRIGYTIPEGASATGKKITLVVVQNSSSSYVTVDWGDGSTETTTAGSGAKTLTHTYSTTGDKIVAITVNTGSISFGQGSSSTVYGSTTGQSTYLQSYIQWVVLGTNVSKLGNYAFYNCSGLKEIRFPSAGFTEIGSSALSYCTALRKVTIPNTVTTISSSAFSYCVALEEVTLPSTVTTLNGTLFGDCYSLTSITIQGSATSIGNSFLLHCRNLSYVNVPSTVATLGTSCFNGCSGLQKLRFNSTTPPAASNANSFNGITTACVISVPTGKLSAYTGASNYPPSGSYTYIEESS